MHQIYRTTKNKIMNQEKELKELNKRKAKALDSMEVINFSLAEINNKMLKILKEKYLDKKIRFYQNNNVVFFFDNKTMQNIPHDLHYTVADVTCTGIDFILLLRTDEFSQATEIMIKLQHLKNNELK